MKSISKLLLLILLAFAFYLEPVSGQAASMGSSVASLNAVVLGSMVAGLNDVASASSHYVPLATQGGIFKKGISAQKERTFPEYIRTTVFETNTGNTITGNTTTFNTTTANVNKAIANADRFMDADTVVKPRHRKGFTAADLPPVVICLLHLYISFQHSITTI